MNSHDNIFTPPPLLLKLLAIPRFPMTNLKNQTNLWQDNEHNFSYIWQKILAHEKY